MLSSKIFSLHGSEKLFLALTKSDMKYGEKIAQFSCLRRFISPKAVKTKAYCQLMCRICGCLDIDVMNIDEMTHRFIFPNEETLSQVVDSSPWCFNNLLLVLKHRNPGMPIAEDMFTMCPFWFIISRLPREYHMLKLVLKLQILCLIVWLSKSKGDRKGKKFFCFRADMISMCNFADKLFLHHC